jgi:hypothetical protein
MTTYTIKTDACSTEIDASTMDAAAAEFAAGEGLRGIDSAQALLDHYDRIGDGAWAWIEGPEGRRYSSHYSE